MIPHPRILTPPPTYTAFVWLLNKLYTVYCIGVGVSYFLSVDQGSSLLIISFQSIYVYIYRIYWHFLFRHLIMVSVFGSVLSAPPLPNIYYENNISLNVWDIRHHFQTKWLYPTTTFGIWLPISPQKTRVNIESTFSFTLCIQNPLSQKVPGLTPSFHSSPIYMVIYEF